MTIGIDPSFTGTGLVVLDGTELVLSLKVKSNIKIYESITNVQLASKIILNEVKDLVAKFPNCDVIIEYPALATKSGAYLAILHGYLSSFLNETELVNSVTYVPPLACDSFIKNREHSKKFIVDFCKKNYNINGRVSHDECTAIVLCNLLKAIQNGTYKNTWFTNKK